MPPKKGGQKKNKFVVDWGDEDEGTVADGAKGGATAAPEKTIEVPASGYFEIGVNPHPGLLIYGVTPAVLRKMTPEDRRKLPHADYRVRRSTA